MRLTLLVMLVAGVSCTDTSGRFHPIPIQEEFRRAMTLAPGSTVSFDTLGPRNWETMYLFGPYVTEEAIRRCMSPTSGFARYGLESRDDLYAVHFRSKQGRISSMSMSTGSVRLAPSAANHEYRRGTALFTTQRVDSLRQVQLVPAGAAPRSCT